jgi:hypothetical protein
MINKTVLQSNWFLWVTLCNAIYDLKNHNISCHHFIKGWKDRKEEVGSKIRETSSIKGYNLVVFYYLNQGAHWVLKLVVQWGTIAVFSTFYLTGWNTVFYLTWKCRNFTGMDVISKVMLYSNPPLIKKPQSKTAYLIVLDFRMQNKSVKSKCNSWITASFGYRWFSFNIQNARVVILWILIYRYKEIW